MRLYGPRVALLLLFLSPSAGRSDKVSCECTAEKPEKVQARQCSLCREAEAAPPDAPIFFLKDASPRKPNRWLALPKAHGTGNHALDEMSPAERATLWEAAIEKAKSLWGEEWGLAYNGEKVRTQCHMHIHIGRLLKGIETERFIVVKRSSEIPAPKGEGLWVHPDGKRLHVHLGEQLTETALFR